tara:strand:- start:45 stop:548 length:504 start_codon:yes stop_codon:yes gene_type:complete
MRNKIILFLILFFILCLLIYNYFFLLREGIENANDKDTEQIRKLHKELKEIDNDLITEKEEKSDTKITFKKFLTKERKKTIINYIKKYKELKILYNDSLVDTDLKKEKKITNHKSDIIFRIVFFSHIRGFFKKEINIDLYNELNTNTNTNTGTGTGTGVKSMMSSFF